MIFSLLKIRKKTAAILAGISVAAMCLWGLSMWQDISLQELSQLLLAVVLMLGAIMLAALLLIAVFKHNCSYFPLKLASGTQNP